MENYSLTPEKCKIASLPKEIFLKLLFNYKSLYLLFEFEPWYSVKYILFHVDCNCFFVYVCYKQLIP